MPRTTLHPGTIDEPVLAGAAAWDGLEQEALRDALVEGLGTTHLDLPPVTAEFMESVGSLVRAFAAGTMTLLRERAETKSTLHGDMTLIDASAINPLKAAWDVDIALQHLFAPQRSDMQQPVPAFSEAYEDLRAHDHDLCAGIHAALAGLLARFDPAALEQRLGSESMLDSLVPGSRKARSWDSFVELYADVRAEAERDFWAVFAREIGGQAPAEASADAAAGARD